MELLARIALAFLWGAWLFPFLFRAPHNQKRASITRKGPTFAGLLLESSAIVLACGSGLLPHEPLAWWRVLAMFLFAAPSIALAWSAVKHLGKQFRVNAGLYEDHELVRTGAYAVVRHPIYSGLLGMLLATIAITAPWQWALISLAMFIVGTEIRVHVEDSLLASRFPDTFSEYQRSVPAYVPFVR
jgi:protein-S-isoprenylcysteine O-methyltransferase Ste14